MTHFCEQPEGNYGPDNVSTYEVCFPGSAGGTLIEGLTGEAPFSSDELHLIYEEEQKSATNAFFLEL